MSMEHQVTTYVRIYSDDAGETHFDEVAVSVTLTTPALQVLFASPIETRRALFCRLRGDLVGGWHPAPSRQFFVLLSGEIEGQVSDGDLRRFGPGAVLLLEDLTGRGHTNRVVGGVDAEAMLVSFA